MVKMLTAYTYELDDSGKAVREISDQLDIKNGLLKNSVALLFCHAKFIEMGVMEAVCKNLPFDVLGCTSLYFATSVEDKSPGTDNACKTGDIMLTVTVLTSDDTEFATGICEPLTAENTEDSIRTLYQNTAASLVSKGDAEAPPELIFAFPPTILNLTIDTMIAALDRACGGIPVFGTVALDMDAQLRHPKTIYRGVAYSDRMPLLLFKGPVTPRFFFVRFPKKSVQAHDAVITGAEGSKIFTINNEPAILFLKELGLIQESSSGFTPAIPLVIKDTEENEPEVFVVQNIDAENSLLCSRQVPLGGIISIGAITADFIHESAKALFREIKESGTGNGTGLFIISCFLRSIVQGKGAEAEVELLQQELGSYPDPWLYLNSGGELCPMYIAEKTVNQALQYALAACQF